MAKARAACEVIAGDVIDIPGLSAQDGERAQLILNTGGLPKKGSGLEEQLRRAVLDGQCSETTSVRSELASMAVAVGGAEFYSFGAETTIPMPAASSRIVALRRSSNSADQDLRSRTLHVFDDSSGARRAALSLGAMSPPPCTTRLAVAGS